MIHRPAAFFHGKYNVELICGLIRSHDGCARRTTILCRRYAKRIWSSWLIASSIFGRRYLVCRRTDNKVGDSMIGKVMPDINRGARQSDKRENRASVRTFITFLQPLKSRISRTRLKRLGKTYGNSITNRPFAL